MIWLRYLPHIAVGVLSAVLAGGAVRLWDNSAIASLKIERAEHLQKDAEADRDRATATLADAQARQKAEREQEQKYQATVAASQRLANTFLQRLEEAENADPQLDACLRLPVPDSLQNATTSGHDSDGSIF